MSRSRRNPGSWDNKQRRIAKHNLIEEERRRSQKEIDTMLEDDLSTWPRDSPFYYAYEDGDKLI
jgi:hypothetical protein